MCPGFRRPNKTAFCKGDPEREPPVSWWDDGNVMKTQNENSSEPRVHSEHIQQQLDELIQHARADIERVTEPRFQALLETSAEVLTGLKKAYQDYDEKKEKAWNGVGAGHR